MSSRKEAIEDFVSRANDYADIEYHGFSIEIRSWNPTNTEVNVVLVDISDGDAGECWLKIVSPGIFVMMRDFEDSNQDVMLRIPADLFRLLYA